MFNRLSNKRKVSFALGFIILVLFVFFKTSISEIKSVKIESERLEIQKNTKCQQLIKLQNTIATFESDSSLNALLSDSTSHTRMDVLTAVSNYVENNKINVYRIEKPIENTEFAIPITTYRMHFNCSYFEGLKLAYYLEQEYSAGRITSLNFHYERAKRSRNQIFITSIYYQTSANYEN